MNVRREDRVVKTKVPTVVITLTQEEFDHLVHINELAYSASELMEHLSIAPYTIQLKAWVDALVEKCKETLA